MRDTDMRHSPLPYEVAGFERALASGAVRLVPAVPPAVSVRPTSARALREALVVVVLAFAGCAAVLALCRASGVGGGPGVVAVLGSSALGCWVVARALRRWGRLLLAELALGYTTTTPGPRTASWWIGWPGRAEGVDWEWDGLWRLGPDGTVRAAPDRRRVPPGLYPSPRREGAMELWTGCQWTGYFPADHQDRA